MTGVHTTLAACFVGLGSNPRARFRLFCFPPAGAGASTFREWRSAQVKDLEVVAVSLPGRENRIRETPLLRVAQIVEQLVDTLPSDRPCAFFGHSMGALVAFEAARALKNDRRCPLVLFASAFRAPQLPSRQPLRHLMSDDELLREMRRLGGTPPELLNDLDLVSILLPRLRADLEVVDTYRFSDPTALLCPLTVFGGISDIDVPISDLEQWRRHTAARFRLQMIEGDHFYLNAARERLIRSIRADLYASTEAATPRVSHRGTSAGWPRSWPGGPAYTPALTNA